MPMRSARRHHKPQCGAMISHHEGSVMEDYQDELLEAQAVELDMPELAEDATEL